MFSTGVYFKIWNVENKGNYTEVECSTSSKNKTTGNYETDFSSKFVRFIGNAHKKRPKPNERVKVTSCGVQNVYEKDGQKNYLRTPTFLVFDFERENDFKKTNENNAASYVPNYGGNENANFIEIGNDAEGLPF